MSFADKVNAQTLQLKENIKSKTQIFTLYFLKVLSGLTIGLTISLALQEIMKFGQLSFLFVILVFTAVFVKMSKNWGFVPLLIFDLICVLVAMLLRMYIVIAPG